MLDPFVGTGTTALTSLFDGKRAIGIDVNPFNLLVAKTKTNFAIDRPLLKEYLLELREVLKPYLAADTDYLYEEAQTREIKAHLSSIWENRKNGNGEEGNGTDVVPMPHLHEWISPRVLSKVMILKNAILKVNSRVQSESIANYGLVAFGAILIPVSNMQLSGPKICYRRKRGRRVIVRDAPVFRLFWEKITTMERESTLFTANSVQHVPELHLGDSRSVDSYVREEVDIAITSPPYLNEVDYLDNTRLQLYFLDFLSSDSDLRAIKERMIRANSKYLYKDNRDFPENAPDIPAFIEISELCEKISVKRNDRKWGWDHPRLVGEYFIDMARHLQGVKNCLKDNGHYIIMVGDSAINQVLVPTDMLLAQIALDIGYAHAEVEPFRWRDSSRHTTNLRESAIILTN